MENNGNNDKLEIVVLGIPKIVVQVNKLRRSRLFLVILLLITIVAPFVSKSYRELLYRRVNDIRYRFVGGAFADASDAGVYLQYMPVPSISNFSASAFTGSATIGYPIKLPPGPGGYSPSLGFNYSSSSVDELMNFSPTNSKRWFARQSGGMGLGWGVSGGSYSISIDTSGEDNYKEACKWKWYINSPGGSAELIKVDSNGQKIDRCVWQKMDGTYAWRKNSAWKDGLWKTDPEIFIKVVSAPSGHTTKGGRWVIKTADNTQFEFGESSNSTYTFGSGATRVASFPHIWGLPQGPGSECPGSIDWRVSIIPTGWKLFKIRNVFGQEIVYNYNVFEKTVGVPGPGACGASGTYIVRSEIENIKYGANEIKFHYGKSREDWRLVHNKTGDYVVDDKSNYGSNDKNILFIADKALSKVEVFKNSNLQRSYQLSYYDAFEKLDTRQDDGKVYGQYKVNDDSPINSFHLTLKSIQEFSSDGTTSLPPNTFTYQQTSFYLKDSNNTDGKGSLFGSGRNNIYIHEAHNGYGGKVVYDFQNPQLIAKVCNESGDCKVNNADSLQRSRLTKLRSSDGVEFWDTIYEYPEDENPLAYRIKHKSQYYTPPPPPPSGYSCGCCDTGDWDPVGGCYERNGNPGLQCCCGNNCMHSPDGSCLSNDNCKPDGGSPTPIHPESTYKLLGYSKVKIATYPKNENITPFQTPPVEPLSSSKQFFHQKVSSSGCFRPDPRAGMSYKSWAMNGNTVTSEVLNNYKFTADNSCGGYIEGQIPLLMNSKSADIGISDAVAISDSQTLYDNKCTNSTCARTSSQNIYNWDFAVSPKHNFDAKKFAALIESVNNGDTSRSGDEVKSVTKYTHNISAGNWILNKPYESYAVDPSDKARKFNHSFVYYDYLDTEEDPASKIGTKGLPTSARTVEHDSGEDFRTYSKFDNYGNVIQSIDPKGNSSFTTYDINHIYPIEVKNALGYTVTTSYDDVLGLPLSVTDANNVSTNFKYDTLGRLTKVIDQGDTENSPSVEYSYTINEKRAAGSLRNGGFESGTQNWNAVGVRIPEFNDGCNWPDLAYEGNCFMKLSSDMNAPDRYIASDFISAGGSANGETFYLSLWVKAHDVNRSGDQVISGIAIQCKPSNGDWGWANTYRSLPNKTLTTNNWTKMEGDITLSGTKCANEVRVVLRGASGSAWPVYYDKVELTQKSASSEDAALIVHTKTKLSGGSYLESYDFFNGIGQKYETQSRQPNGKALTSVSHTDSLGRATVAYNPFEHGSFGTSVVYAPDGVAKSETFFDAKGRVVRTELPDGRITRNLYNEPGFRTAIVDPEGKVVVSVSDGLGRTVKSLNCKNKNSTWCTDSDALVTSFDTDVMGSTLGVTDSDGVVITENVFDTIGRRKESRDMDLGKWGYTYDKNGGLLTQTSPRGDVVKFEYDELGRVTRQLFNDQEKLRYSYDSAANGVGKKASYEDSYQKTSYSYDNKGRLSSITKDFSLGELSNLFTDNPYTFTYQYDSADRMTSLAYPQVANEASEVLSFGFNGPYLKTASGTDPYVVDTKYNIFGSVTERTLGNGVVEKFAFDNKINRLTNIAYQNGGGNFVDLGYEYNPSGNISRINDSIDRQDANLGMTQSYTYDNYYRLTGVGNGVYDASYVYDNINRILQKTFNGNTIDFSY